jgi:hypothetical protein
MRAEHTIRGSGRSHVERSTIAIHSRPGIHCTKRAAERCGVTAPRCDQQTSVSQTQYKAVGVAVAIKTSPEHNVPGLINCLHGIARERQAKALPAVDRIEEHNDLSPASRAACKPTGIESVGSRTVISKEGDLSRIVN